MRYEVGEGIVFVVVKTHPHGRQRALPQAILLTTVNSEDAERERLRTGVDAFAGFVLEADRDGEGEQPWLQEIRGQPPRFLGVEPDKIFTKLLEGSVRCAADASAFLPLDQRCGKPTGLVLP